MSSKLWIQTFIACTDPNGEKRVSCIGKRKREELGYELDTEIYATLSWHSTFSKRETSETKDTSFSKPTWELILDALKNAVLARLKIRPHPKKAIVLRNPSASGYHPMNVVYFAIERYLQGKTVGKDVRKIYTSLSKKDHEFFMNCLNSSRLSEADLNHYRRLVPLVKEDQLAFHLYRQLTYIKNADHLNVYLSCKPEVLIAVDGWFRQKQSKIYDMPRYYILDGTINGINETTQMIWISENTSLEKLPSFDRFGYSSLWKRGEERLLNSEIDVLEEDLPLEDIKMGSAKVIVSESVLVCFQLSGTDAKDPSFEIPVKVILTDGQKRIIFGEPLPKKELDLRQKQEIFFDRALSRRYATKSKDSISSYWITSEWRLGTTSVLVRRVDRMRASTPTSTRSVPIKIFPKFEYASQLFPNNPTLPFEEFTSEELAKYWMALFIRRKGEVHVAHMAPESGKRLKDSKFTAPEQLLQLLPSFLQFQIKKAIEILHSVVNHLDKRSEGNYLVVYDKTFSEISCLKAIHKSPLPSIARPWIVHPKTQTSDVVYDLHTAYSEIGKTCLSRIPYVPQQWQQIISHGAHIRIPHTFPFRPNSKF